MSCTMWEWSFSQAGIWVVQQGAVKLGQPPRLLCISSHLRELQYADFAAACSLPRRLQVGSS